MKRCQSRGNVINPDDIINEFGADTLRAYEMFIGAFELSAAWSNEGVKGCRRFLERVWKLQDMLVDGDEYSKELETRMHQTIKKVTLDYENLKFNTAIAAMMSLVNDFYRVGKVTKGEFATLIILLNPVVPHVTEELWQEIGKEGRVYEATWPEYDEEKTVEDTIEIAVQINGKVKATVSVGREDEQDAVREIVMALESIATLVEGKTIVKEIYVKGRIYNIVVK